MGWDMCPEPKTVLGKHCKRNWSSEGSALLFVFDQKRGGLLEGLKEYVMRNAWTQTLLLSPSGDLSPRVGV